MWAWQLACSSFTLLVIPRLSLLLFRSKLYRLKSWWLGCTNTSGKNHRCWKEKDPFLSWHWKEDTRSWVLVKFCRNGQHIFPQDCSKLQAISHLCNLIKCLPKFVFTFWQKNRCPFLQNFTKTQLLVSSFQCHDRNGSFFLPTTLDFPTCILLFLFFQASGFRKWECACLRTLNFWEIFFFNFCLFLPKKSRNHKISSFWNFS